MHHVSNLTVTGCLWMAKKWRTSETRKGHDPSPLSSWVPEGGWKRCAFMPWVISICRIQIQNRRNRDFFAFPTILNLQCRRQNIGNLSLSHIVPQKVNLPFGISLSFAIYLGKKSKNTEIFFANKSNNTKIFKPKYESNLNKKERKVELNRKVYLLKSS